MILEIITTLLLYLFAVLQVSFFAHFLFFGAVLNLVVIMFLLTVFFLPQKINYKIFLYALISGLLLDMYSYAYFGFSVVLLVVVGYLFKKTQLMLKENKDGFSFAHFIILFLFWFAVYKFLIILCFKFLNSSHADAGFNSIFLLEIIYNAIIASVGFFIYKKIRPLLAE